MTALVPVSAALAMLVLAAHTCSQEASSTPSELERLHRHYGGELVPLELDAHRLLVGLRVDADSSVLWAGTGSADTSLVSLQPVAARGSHLLTLRVPLQGPAAAARQCEALLELEGVVFASPVFRGFEDNWAAPTPAILVRFKPSHIAECLVELESGPAHLFVDRAQLGGMEGAFRLRCDARNGLDVLDVANTLAADPRVEWAEPDWLFSGRSAFIPNDGGFADLWGMRNTGQFSGTLDMDMDADLAWDITTGSSLVHVMVMDTGVQQNHPDLSQVPGADYTGQGGAGGPINACDNHGTPVAGCISAIMNNGFGTVGIAPSCRTFSARVMSATPACDGGWTSVSSWTANALADGYHRGIRVTNNSNTTRPARAPPRPVQQALPLA